MSALWQACAVTGFIAFATSATIVLLVVWVQLVRPRVHALIGRLRAWRERRAAIARVLAESRVYMGREFACRSYRATGKLEVRGGIMSDFCRRCGMPCGAHRARVPR